MVIVMVTVMVTATDNAGFETCVSSDPTNNCKKINDFNLNMLTDSYNDGPFIYRLNDTGTGPLLLTQVCLERGWREYTSEASEQWNLWWRSSSFPIHYHKSLRNWQYINHVPQGSLICRKDNLVRYLRCMRKIYGSIYDFSPNGYNLPSEYTKLAAEYSSKRPLPKSSHSFRVGKPIWICKPVSQSQGKGIFIFTKLSELSYDTNTIVQRYIENPLLIGGYKFDLRLYVCIPSYHPMTVYLYQEGLVRFGTDKFTLKDLESPFRHLTNTSINKLSPGYTEMKENIGSGCKWTLRQLRRYFQQIGVCDWLLWQKISVLIVLTLLSQAKYIPPSINCFEFFGVDVLIDNMLKPWLLEVNLSPALGNDCDVDRLVKKPMLHEMFDLLGLPLCNMALPTYAIWDNETKECSRGKYVMEDLSVQSSALMIHVAKKWRNHNKIQDKQISKNKSITIQEPQTPSFKYSHSQKLHALEETLTVRKINNKPMDAKLSNKWSNGRNWKNAPPHEGRWVRIWPMNLCINYNTATHFSTKSVVAQMVKFNKMARNISKKYPAATDSQLNEYLQVEMSMSGEIWLPSI
ncbi:hypothetical protein Trydic_g8328 [Trypoxylus dichotomus]